MLTIKQEKFIQNIVKGMSQREAYKNAYSAKYKAEVIDVRACELFKSSKVQVRYKELLNELKDETIMSAKERQIWLTKVINGEVKIKQECDNEIKEYEPYMTDKLKALDILNKMDGQYVTKVKGDLDVTIEVGISED